MPERLRIEVTTIGDLVDRHESAFSGEAIVFPDSRTTYPQLAERSDALARALRGAGVGPGDKASDSPSGVQLSKRAVQANQDVPYSAAPELENRGHALLHPGRGHARGAPAVQGTSGPALHGPLVR
jgi:hypothetical protein